MGRILELKNNLEFFKQKMEKAKAMAGDAGRNVQLVAVSKTFPAEDIRMLYDLGVRDFGENRVQELKDKGRSDILGPCADIRWHFIGHIQSNKIKMLLQIPHLAYIHSVDSLKLMKILYQNEGLVSHSIGFFLEINTSGEEEKSGIQTEAELNEILDLIRENPHSKFKLVGLMTMGNIRGEDFERDAHACFSKLNDMGKRINQSHPELPELRLSMGMSSDYEMAMQHGADYIRIGSALFGSR